MGSAYRHMQRSLNTRSVRVASKRCTCQWPRANAKDGNTWDARAVSGHHHCWDAWDAGVIARGPAKTSTSAAHARCSLVVPPAPQCAARARPGSSTIGDVQWVQIVTRRLHELLTFGSNSPALVKRCSRECAYQGRKHFTFIRLAYLLRGGRGPA